MAKYLSKERPECLYRWRLWAGFGKGWEWTRVKDIIRETLFSRIIGPVGNGRPGQDEVGFLNEWIWFGGS